MAVGNEAVQDELIQYGVRLDRFTADTTQRANFILQELSLDLAGAVAEADLPGQAPTRQARRTATLLDQVKITIDDSYQSIFSMVQGDLHEIAAISNIEAAKAINVGLTVRVARPTLTAGELRVLSQDPIIRGRPSSEWWEGQSQNTRNRFAQEMRLGIAQGETNDDLVRRIIGKKQPGAFQTVIDPKTGKAKKVPRLSGGIMETGRREAEALVRTSVQTVSNDVLMDSYRANANILRGVAALVTLDSRTTPICMSRSGAIWDVVTGEPLPESTQQEPMPPPPPFHWNCRTIFMPVTKSWDELRNARGKGKLPAADKRKLDTVPKKTRASIDGKVPGDLNFSQWLKTKDKQFQVEQLGPGRWKLWNEGKISLSQLTDFSGRTLTLKELRAASAG